MPIMTHNFATSDDTLKRKSTHFEAVVSEQAAGYPLKTIRRESGRFLGHSAPFKTKQHLL